MSGNNGTPQNGATFAPGEVGQAFNLDGVDDFVNVPNAPNLTPTNAITVDAWIFLRSQSTNDFKASVIVAKDEFTTGERDYLLHVVNGQLQFVVFRSGSLAQGLVTGGAINLNTWHHVAGTYDGGIVRAYVDGVEVASSAFTGNINHSGTPFRIGSTNHAGRARFFDGLIDELELFDRALTQAEVQAIFNARSAGKCNLCENVTCSATDQCHDVGTCNPATGQCTNPVKADGSSCDDSSACTSGDTCQNGTCTSGPPLNCDDSNACTDDRCDPTTGCVSTSVNCDDGNACTGDSCDPATGCVSTPVNCDDGNACTADSCDQTSGCVHTPIPNCTNATQTGFVIGDRNAIVGNRVTFWGPRWANANSLSGGAAPSNFKGYANEPTPNPPSCGGTWKSLPGNSSGPPATVPQYIIVLVASKITKSGSVISGNIPEMVVVRTDPGYDANPGHDGTGTVVSIVCGSTAELTTPANQSNFWFDLYWAVPVRIGSWLVG